MRRLGALAIGLGLAVFVPAGFAQEHPAESSAPAEKPEKNLDVWKWANFLLLAGGLGYLAGKNGGPYFASRSQKIREDMVEAAEVRKEAEARAAEVERRLANLETEIGRLRSEAQVESKAEVERASQRTAADIAKIQMHSEQEIAAAGKAARTELKRYAAHLALELAERKIRTRMTPEEQDALTRGFVSDLERPAGPDLVRS